MVHNNNQATGFIGENAAVNFLQKKGFKIIDRNTRKRYGEIDIVAIDNTSLVFVEVKTRRGQKFGLPEESINYRKMKSLLKSINYYKLIHPSLPDEMRIDVVCVYLGDDYSISKVLHYPNVTS